MRELKAALFVAPILLIVLIYFDNRETFQRATHRAADATVLWWTVFLWVLLALSVVAVLFVLYLAYVRSYHPEPNRIRNGHAELRQYRINRNWRNLWMGQRLLVDPNLMQAAAAVIDDNGYQEIGAIPESIRLEVQRTRHLSAVYPGDEALAAQRMPRSIEQPRVDGSTRKLITANASRPVPATPALSAPSSLDAYTYTAGKALNESTADGLILGQADDGKLCRVNLRQALNVGVIGAPGTGKTASTGFHLALALRKAGARLTILDPKGGADWRAFARVAEWHESDYTVIRDQMQHVFAEYERRAAIAKRTGVSHLMELRDPSLPPLVVIVEEYGDLCRELRGRGKRGDVDAMDAMIDTIVSKGRYTDVHFVLIDQYPEEWSSQVMMATKAKILYQVGPNQGALVGDWHAQKLPDSGAFRHKDQQYNAWHIKPNLPQYLAALPANPYPALIDGSAVRPSAPPDGGVSTSGSGQADTVADTQADTVADTQADTATDAQQRIINYYAANPGAGVREAARVLGLSKSYVSDVRRGMVELGSPPPTDAYGRPQTVIDAGDPANAEALAAIRQAIKSGQATVKGRKP